MIDAIFEVSEVITKWMKDACDSDSPSLAFARKVYLKINPLVNVLGEDRMVVKEHFHMINSCHQQVIHQQQGRKQSVWWLSLTLACTQNRISPVFIYHEIRQASKGKASC